LWYVTSEDTSVVPLTSASHAAAPSVGTNLWVRQMSSSAPFRVGLKGAGLKGVEVWLWAQGCVGARALETNSVRCDVPLEAPRLFG